MSPKKRFLQIKRNILGIPIERQFQDSIIYGGTIYRDYFRFGIRIIDNESSVAIPFERGTRLPLVYWAIVASLQGRRKRFRNPDTLDLSFADVTRSSRENPKDQREL